MRHNDWARALEPTSPRAATTEACAPRACAPQQEKPPRWEARALLQRVTPAQCNQRKPMHSNEDPTQPKINKLKKIFWKKWKIIKIDILYFYFIFNFLTSNTELVTLYFILMLVVFNVDATTQFFFLSLDSLYISLYDGHKAIHERFITFLLITLSFTTWLSMALFRLVFLVLQIELPILPKCTMSALPSLAFLSHFSECPFPLSLSFVILTLF